nr:retrovirus-related Pol polyprotein from transposon TNT 1-94 [Tanacetum cinerariifolium]
LGVLSEDKDEMFGKLKEWKTLVDKQTGKQVKTLRTYNGLEFCITSFDNFCKKKGIVRHHTIRHTSQQNGVAERMNQTLMARARDVTFDESAMLGQSRCYESFACAKDYDADKKVVLAMVCAFNLELERLDVKTAFFHGNLEE